MSLLLYVAVLLYTLCLIRCNEGNAGDADDAGDSDDAGDASDASVKVRDHYVSTNLGTIKGYTMGGISRYLGIPYVEPPNRFRPAEPKLPWNGVLDATKFGAVCPQPNVTYIHYGDISENCLFLNIYVPLKRSKSLPVMVFIHGGSFNHGTGNTYNGTRLAQQNVIVITINYRLNVFGFFPSTEIAQENPNFPSLGGLNGILDQIRALQWIKNNVHYFGGDSSKITVFGESAGSLSICYMLCIPMTKGLFQHAIMESYSCIVPWGGPNSKARSLLWANAFLRSVNVTSLAGLRQLSVNTILQSPSVVTIVPSLDDYLLSIPPIAFFENNSLTLPSSSPLIIGSNNLDTELVPLFTSAPLPTTPESFRNALLPHFGPNDTDAIMKVYNPNSTAGPTTTFRLLNAQACIVCPMKFTADFLSDFHHIYLYSFSYNPPTNLAPHASELPHVFGQTANMFGVVSPWPYNESLSLVMRQYWTSFAIEGKPQSHKSAVHEWKRYSKNDPFFVDFGVEVSGKKDYFQSNCDFWKSYYLNNQVNADKVLFFCFQPTAGIKS